jgi:hypothetical protein
MPPRKDVLKTKISAGLLSPTISKKPKIETKPPIKVQQQVEQDVEEEQDVVEQQVEQDVEEEQAVEEQAVEEQAVEEQAVEESAVEEQALPFTPDAASLANCADVMSRIDTFGGWIQLIDYARSVLDMTESTNQLFVCAIELIQLNESVAQVKNKIIENSRKMLELATEMFKMSGEHPKELVPEGILDKTLKTLEENKMELTMAEQVVYEAWVSVDDLDILPPEEIIEKCTHVCFRFDAHEKKVLMKGADPALLQKSKNRAERVQAIQRAIKSQQFVLLDNPFGTLRRCLRNNNALNLRGLLGFIRQYPMLTNSYNHGVKMRFPSYPNAMTMAERFGELDVVFEKLGVASSASSASSSPPVLNLPESRSRLAKLSLANTEIVTSQAVEYLLFDLPKERVDLIWNDLKGNSMVSVARKLIAAEYYQVMIGTIPASADFGGTVRQLTDSLQITDLRGYLDHERYYFGQILLHDGIETLLKLQYLREQSIEIDADYLRDLPVLPESDVEKVRAFDHTFLKSLQRQYPPFQEMFDGKLAVNDDELDRQWEMFCARSQTADKAVSEVAERVKQQMYKTFFDWEREFDMDLWIQLRTLHIEKKLPVVMPHVFGELYHIFLRKFQAEQVLRMNQECEYEFFDCVPDNTIEDMNNYYKKARESLLSFRTSPNHLRFWELHGYSKRMVKYDEFAKTYRMQYENSMPYTVLITNAVNTDCTFTHYELVHFFDLSAMSNGVEFFWLGEELAWSDRNHRKSIEQFGETRFNLILSPPDDDQFYSHEDLSSWLVEDNGEERTAAYPERTTIVKPHQLLLSRSLSVNEEEPVEESVDEPVEESVEVDEPMEERDDVVDRVIQESGPELMAQLWAAVAKM